MRLGITIPWEQENKQASKQLAAANRKGIAETQFVYSDPLKTLVEDCKQRQKPSLAWTVYWVQPCKNKGKDPLVAAWLNSSNVEAKKWILQHTGHEYLVSRLTDADKSKQYGACQDAIPISCIPTLNELMEALTSCPV